MQNVKIKLSSTKHHYMKRVSIFLITIALVAVVAGCKGIWYDVTISSTAGGSVTVPGEGIFTYEFCTEVSLVATPDSGYRFVKWTGDVEAIADVNSASTIITSVQGNYFITANFEQIPPGQFGLTVSSTAGGSVTVPGEGTFIYDAGTVVNLVAAPAGSYQFDNWTGDVGTIANVNSASTTIAMEGNYSITANFVQIPPGKFGLTVSSTAGGSVTVPGEGTFIYDAGTEVSLMTTPASGYQFDNWTGDVGTIANVNSASTTIAMEGNYSITANFEQIPPGQFGLTVSSTAGGSVTIPGEGTFIYDAGTVVNLVATPASGYQFDNWTGDVGTIADVNSASTTVAMEGNYSITANFDVIPPAIPPLFTVGLTCYTVNKLAVMAPWIALGAAIVVGASLLVLRRRRVRDRGV